MFLESLLNKISQYERPETFNSLLIEMFLEKTTEILLNLSLAWVYFQFSFNWDVLRVKTNRSLLMMLWITFNSLLIEMFLEWCLSEFLRISHSAFAFNSLLIEMFLEWCPYSWGEGMAYAGFQFSFNWDVLRAKI